MVNWDEYEAVFSTKGLRLLAFRVEEIIGVNTDRQAMTYKNLASGVLNAHPFFRKLRRHTLNDLMNDFNFESLKDNTTFCQENQYLNNLVILISGSLVCNDPGKSVRCCKLLYGNSLTYTSVPSSFRAKETLTASNQAVVGHANLYRVAHLLKNDLKEMLEDRVVFSD